jgi:NitT/TauT family transport system permease protein
MPNIFSQIITSSHSRALPNRWDVIALILVLAILLLLAWAASQMTTPYHLGQAINISLSPHDLPNYALRTAMRIFIALIFSFLFTLTFGTWAAKSKYAGQIIIPAIDILQSIPVLGFLSITVVGFIHLFPNSLLGPECAAIFAIFTAQAWNMALSFYQSMRTLPDDLKEVAEMFHLTPWQRFWRVEVAFAMPGLLWNTMLSVSASWFSVVVSEAITVSGQEIALPGIGSYIALAIKQANVHAVFYAIFTMLLVIIVYDQLMFRPLIKWSDRFNAEQTTNDNITYSWVIDLLQRTYSLRSLGHLLTMAFDKFVNLAWLNHKPRYRATHAAINKHFIYLWYTALLLIIAVALYFLYRFIVTALPLTEFRHVLFLGLITTLRVMILIIVSSLIWVPIGVWVGMRPRVAAIVQPIAQFLAAFPTYVLFPVVVLTILRYHLNVEIWVTPLMILGTQWYILFNVIAGASALPKELNQAAANFGVRGWLRWKRLILPGIFPFYVTGAMTAMGGAWNTSIVAEIVHWGNTTLRATGLGAYITESTQLGDFPRLALGIGVMCLLVLILNHIIWRPLYALAEARFRLD